MRAVAVTSAVVAFALCASAIQGKSFGSAPTNSQAASGWRDTFDVHKSNLLPTGTNPYITMQPGRVLKLKHGKDTLTVTILRETQQIDGVTAGILEERETKNGKVVNHESAWRAGVAGARLGLMIPAKPMVGQKFYQEIAPKVAMDRVEVVSIDETVKTPAGVFEHCVHLRETTPLERDVSHKYYAPGIGIIKDDEFELAER